MEPMGIMSAEANTPPVPSPTPVCTTPLLLHYGDNYWYDSCSAIERLGFGAEAALD